MPNMKYTEKIKIKIKKVLIVIQPIIKRGIKKIHKKKKIVLNIRLKYKGMLEKDVTPLINSFHGFKAEKGLNFVFPWLLVFL